MRRNVDNLIKQIKESIDPNSWKGGAERRQGRDHLPPGEHGPDRQGVGRGARHDGEHVQQVISRTSDDSRSGTAAIRGARSFFRWRAGAAGC